MVNFFLKFLNSIRIFIKKVFFIAKLLLVKSSKTEFFKKNFKYKSRKLCDVIDQLIIIDTFKL